MKRIIFLLFFVFMINLHSQTFRRTVDFTNRPIGLNKSSVYAEVLRKRLMARPVLYTTMNEGLNDLRGGKIDGFLVDLYIARELTAEAQNFDLRIIEIPDNAFLTNIGACSHDRILIERFNLFLRKIQADGTLDEMQTRWFETKGDVEHPVIQSSGLKGIIKVGTNSRARPFSFIADDKFTGYSIELVQRFAADLEYRIEFVDLVFHQLIPFVRNKKIDMAISNISITTDRRRIVLFSEPIFVGRAGILVRS